MLIKYAAPSGVVLREAAKRHVGLTVAGVVVGWVALLVLVVCSGVAVDLLPGGDVLLTGGFEHYSEPPWVTPIRWVILTLPFMVSGWIVARVARRRPLVPLATFAVSASAAMLAFTIFDNPPRLDHWRMGLTILFVTVTPAPLVVAGGLVAARDRASVWSDSDVSGSPPLVG